MTRTPRGPIGAPPALPRDSLVPELARVIEAAGGRLIVVGGWVRDQLLEATTGSPTALIPDLDLEVFGLETSRIAEILEPFGSIGKVGRQFPVWRLAHQSLDVSFPREGGLDYRAEPAAGRKQSLARAFAKAARHRDLTINAMGWDPLDASLIDPWDGRGDLARRRLRAVDPSTFIEDPVRGLRVARLAARFEATIDPDTLRLCRGLDFTDVPIERKTSELKRMLLEPRCPSKALEWVAESDLLRLFPPLAALRGVPQDPKWHPEGDVFVHTGMVLDCAHEIGADLPGLDRETLQWAALCHDLGKPATTRVEAGRVRALQHDRLGAEITRDWLGELRVSKTLAAAVAVLVADHLAPAQYVTQAAGARAYRRLARRLAAGGMTVVDLERLARADQLGRTTESARAGRFDEGPLFLAAAEAEGLLEGPVADVLRSEHLLERGIEPGVEFGTLLARARHLQDEHGWDDPERLLDAALDSLGLRATRSRRTESDERMR